MGNYLELCKPKVVLLMLITALVGMCLAVPGPLPIDKTLYGLLGIALAAGAAATVNHLLDRHIDAMMARTLNRPIAKGKVAPKQALIFAGVLALFGMIILYFGTNPLAALLSFLTLMGYAVIYTVYLKRATPQNIVIGGLAGAAPPLLGWVAMTGQCPPESLLLVLIIYTWTPPHFWALAIYRHEDYKKADIPMLPVTHGIKFTKLSIILYTLLLIAASLLPYIIHMFTWRYALIALLLGLRFLYWTLKLWVTETPRVAMQTFRFSIVYLFWLFITMLADHYW